MPNLLKKGTVIEEIVKGYGFLEYNKKSGEKGTVEKSSEKFVSEYTIKEIESEKPEEAAEEETVEELHEEPEVVEEEHSEQDEKAEEMLREAEETLNAAKAEAQKILQEAEAQAAALKEEETKKGYEAGYDNGFQKGYDDAVEKVNITIAAETGEFLNELKEVIESVAHKKEDVLRRYIDDLKEIAIAVGEKVIKVSLKSSGDIIERMIVAATERLKTKEWAKVYIAKADAEVMVEGSRDIIRALSDISEHVKVVAMENEKSGTCILEFPDEIIDASVGTQVENIKEILKNTGV
ncbi:MAG: flagellar biosynthesis/type III secretory pathway protein [Firmicutes bacterium]|nr:flagellar biosynthesis/type III secretory pathway protein [Bacillota bacterium]